MNCFIGCVVRVLRNYGIQRDDVGGSGNIEKFDKKKMVFLKSVLRFNKLNRSLYYDMINETPNIHLIVFKNRKQVKDYLRNL